MAYQPATMDSAQVHLELVSGNYKVRQVIAGRSEVWKRFGIVVDNNDCDLDFVACMNCTRVLSYRGRQSGTATLSRHKCKTTGRLTMPTVPSKHRKSKVGKDTITSAGVNMMYQNLHLLDTVSDPDFITLAREPTPDITFDEIPKEGLTGGEDRGSSEYSQNEEETAVTISPEHFLGETSEREPTPAPVSQTPPKPESYQLRHNNHLTIVLEALARDEAFMDVTLTAQGRSLKAHKSVLSAVSAYFRGVLRENPCQHPIIIMPRDVRFEELFSIVNYIYKGEMTVAAEDLTSLLKTAELLQVSGLAPSDSSATVNPNTTNIRSSSASSSSSSNVTSIPKTARPVKETNQGISAPIARPRSPDGMINPSDFMDMDMTYVKEEVQSGGEEEDEDTTTSETPAQRPPKNTSPKINEMQQSEDPLSFSSMYNPNQEQTSASTSSSQDYSGSLVKSETEANGTPNMETDKSSTDDPQPFICPHCQEQHRGVDNMTTHLRLNHPTKPGFVCGCGRVFTRNMLHQAHIKVCRSSS